MLTITPPPAATMPAAAACAHRRKPVWFTARVRATCSWFTSRSAAGRLMPALLTRISTGAGAAANRPRTLSGSVTSTATKRCPASAPRANSAATRAPASAARSAATTRVPTSANASATARPMPDAAPVTTTVFPASCNQPSIADANIAPPAQPRAPALTKIPAATRSAPTSRLGPSGSPAIHQLRKVPDSGVAKNITVRRLAR